MQWSKRISEAFEAVSLGHHDWPVLVHSLPEGTWTEVQQLLGILPANLETMCLMLALIVIRDMCNGYAEFLVLGIGRLCRSCQKIKARVALWRVQTLWREVYGFATPILGPNKAWVAALAAVFP